MKDHVLASVRLLVVFTLLLGFGYPAAVWAVGRVAFPREAGGSFVTRDGKVVGSELIGQAVTSSGLFRTRPYAAGAGYDAAASGGSNLGPTSKALADRVAAEAAKAGGGRTFYDFPAEHWIHIRTTNPIESTFATVRLRTAKTKGCGSRIAKLEDPAGNRAQAVWGDDHIRAGLLN